MQVKKISRLKKAQEAINLHQAIKNELIIEGKKGDSLSTSDYIAKFNQLSKENWKGISWEKSKIKKQSFVKTILNQLTNKSEPWKLGMGGTVLSSYEFKNELVNMASFKQLKIHVSRSGSLFESDNQKKSVKKLMKKIYEATDDSWYEEFKNKEGQLWEIYISTKKTDMKTTIKSFISDIEDYKEKKIKASMRTLTTKERESREVLSASTSPPHHSSEATIFAGLARKNLKEAAMLADNARIYESQQRAEDEAKMAKEMDEKLFEKIRNPKHQDMIELGRLYVKLMLEAENASGLPLEEIQFSFCVNVLPSDKKTVQEAIEMYVNYELKEAELDENIKLRLQKITHPFTVQLSEDASKLRSYDSALTLRGQSYRDAAQLIVDNTEIDGSSKETIKAKIQELHAAFKNDMENPHSQKEHQAYFDAFIKSLNKLIKKELSTEDNRLTSKMVDDYLANAETINNIKNYQSQITISGNLDNRSSYLHGNVSYQIEQPLRKFKDLSKEQQEEWVIAIKAHKAWVEAVKLVEQVKDTDTELKINVDVMYKEIPKWFRNMPAFEKNLWVDRLNVDENGKVADINREVAMGPVVKKQGIPGLRNLYLSSFATTTYKNGMGTTSVSDKTVRSSNLVVQKKEKSFFLKDYEKKLTRMNVKQINYLYEQYNIENNFIKLWGTHVSPDRPKYLLCQTLLRKMGGGDDFVIGHKKAAIKKVDSTYFVTLHHSNHCIGAPKSLHRPIHMVNTNTTTMNHITDPLDKFMEVVVKPAIKNALMAQGSIKEKIDEKLDKLVEKAKRGELHQDDINATFEGRYLNDYFKVSDDALLIKQRAKQRHSLERTLQAVNMYAQISASPSVHEKASQLHMAALEEIIYQDTGNRVQSSCKSGKDREGIEKTYRNATIMYFDLKGHLPPSEENGSRERKDFIAMFITLFKTNHQARLAELNADGCQGLKSIQNILPEDIYTELERDGREFLNSHARNSELNVYGHSAVTPDADTYKSAKDNYAKTQGEVNQGIEVLTVVK